MKKVIMSVILLILLTTISIVTGNQQKDIYFDTKGNTGHLIYMEQYYSLNNSNNSLTLEDERIYFDGVINNSKITFMIIRPLDKNRNPYSESMIKAIATLDGKTILYTWYNYANPNNATTKITNEVKGHNQDTIIGLVIIIVAFLLAILSVRKIIKKRKK